jgi:hypothetical protein
MISAKENGLNSDSDMRDSAKKEWHRPELRKLPIRATAQSQAKNPSGDDGVASPGDASGIS